MKNSKKAFIPATFTGKKSERKFIFSWDAIERKMKISLKISSGWIKIADWYPGKYNIENSVCFEREDLSFNIVSDVLNHIEKSDLF